MSFYYGEHASPNIKSTSTLEAIKNGERTATTRYERDGNIDYWKQANIGDVIEFHNKEGQSVKVVVTKPLTKLVSPIQQLDLFPSSLPLTGVELMALYEQGNSRINEALNQMEDLTPENRQTHLNEFAQFMSNNKVDTQDKLEEALRKFICNL